MKFVATANVDLAKADLVSGEDRRFPVAHFAKREPFSTQLTVVTGLSNASSSRDDKTIFVFLIVYG